MNVLVRLEAKTESALYRINLLSNQLCSKSGYTANLSQYQYLSVLTELSSHISEPTGESVDDIFRHDVRSFTPCALMQPCVAITLIGAQNVAKFLGHGDHDMEVMGRQQFGLARAGDVRATPWSVRQPAPGARGTTTTSCHPECDEEDENVLFFNL